jgi:outer membrane protein assembly factor BamB
MNVDGLRECLLVTERRSKWRIADALAGMVIAASIIALWRRTSLERSEVFDSIVTLNAVVAGIAVAGLLFAYLGARGSFAMRGAQRFAAYSIAGLLLLAVLTRVATGSFIVPPRYDPKPARFDSMSLANRLHWAVRTAQYASAIAVDRSDQLFVPVEWPFPDDVELARMRGAAGNFVVARVRGTDRTCAAVLIGEARHVIPDAPACVSNDAEKLSLPFSKPVRGPLPRVPASAAIGEPWPQYRRDAAKGAATAANGNTRAWIVPLRAGVRASASVVGNLAIVGTHGAGTIEAFSIDDGKPRWSMVLPNWVHQDAVSDGRTVLIGFGDNVRSFTTKAPGGVSAIDASSGRIRWTAFEPGSQMTSPIIWRNQTAYVTSSGRLRVRQLETGAELWSAALDGTVLMGPPALRGDTLIISLDNSGLCSVSLEQRRVLWCKRVPGMLLMGHTSPSLFGDTIIVSGIPSPGFSNYVRNFRHVSNRVRIRWLVGFLRPNGRNIILGQRVSLVDLKTGNVIWRGPDLFQAKPIRGHISGAATIDDSTIVMNLPLPNVVLAFDRTTMRTLWTATEIDARGPVLLFQNRVYYVTGLGELRVHDARTGVLRCSVSVGRMYDRSGPALGHGALLFASLEGDLAAVPLRDLDECRAREIEALFASLPVQKLDRPHMRPQ